LEEPGSPAIVEEVRTYFKDSSPLNFTIFNKSVDLKTHQVSQDKAYINNVEINSSEDSRNSKGDSKISFCADRDKYRKFQKLLKKKKFQVDTKKTYKNKKGGK